MRVCVAALVAGLSLAVAGCGGSESSSGSSGDKAAAPADASGPLVVAAFGGAYGKAEEQAYFKPFQDQADGKVRLLQAEPSLAQIQLQVKNKKVLWDVAELAAPDAVRGCRDGTLEKLVLPSDATGQVEKEALFDCGVAASIYTEGIGYDPSKVKGTPTWEDFFDLKKYPGRRTMEKYLLDGTLEHALLGDGVAPGALYPLDVDRALEKMDSLGDQLVLVDSLAQASQSLSSGAATMIQTASGRILDLQRGGEKVAFAPIGQRGASIFVVPKGAPRREAAMRFLEFIATCPECSTTMANLTAYSGPNAEGNTKANASVRKLLPSSPEVQKVSYAQDVEWWAQNAASVQKKFETFAAGQ